jgi:hypothetical protein
MCLLAEGGLYIHRYTPARSKSLNDYGVDISMLPTLSHECVEQSSCLPLKETNMATEKTVPNAPGDKLTVTSPCTHGYHTRTHTLPIKLW